MNSRSFIATFVISLWLTSAWVPSAEGAAALPKIRIAPDGRSFATETGQPFVPLGVNYYRPGTGWAPQLWKKFDAAATRQDFARMKELGVNCVRVFLSYGSFYMEPGKLSPEGLEKFDQFLSIAEEAGIYVHPTGPDHWEGTPEWARGDRYADENILRAQESFWKLLAQRYRGRNVIFAYDLLNEPEVRWDSPPMKEKWVSWVVKKYGTAENAVDVWWGRTNKSQFGPLTVPTLKQGAGLESIRDAKFVVGHMPIPSPEEGGAPGLLGYRQRELLDYQLFRESIADDWTRRQAAAIKSADPNALVTVGLIQWSIPALLPAVQHYSGFRPERQAQFLDFMEIHFYPLNQGFFEYRSAEEEGRNLAYLESVVREVARAGKAVVVAEFGWYGGGKPTIDGGKHAAASEEQQARWCREAVETTAGLATGWLNWGFYDHPEARDVSQLTGLLTVDGKVKAWGKEFKALSAQYKNKAIPASPRVKRPGLDWNLCLTNTKAASQFREKYYQAYSLEK